MRKSPVIKFVERLDDKTVARAIQRYIEHALLGADGWKILYQSWDMAFDAAAKSGTLHQPRYLTKSEDCSEWIVRERYSRHAIARHENGPQCLSRAVLVIILGKGHEYGNNKTGDEQLDEKLQSVLRYGRCDR